MSILSVDSLTKYYGRRLGVDGLNFELEEGSVCGFLGPNGVGKSTTIRLLLGFLRPTHGNASIFGLDCWRHSGEIKREVGYVPGDLRLYSWLTGRSALRMVGRIRGCALETEGLKLMERYSLDPDVRVSRMSRGMRQKVGLILALAPRPRLLVLDEPTSGLDPVIQETLKEHLLELAAAGGTIFFSSHSLAEVERLCDRVLILNAGKLVADSPLEELRERAAREVMIRWKPGGAEGVEPPAELDLSRREDDLWRGAWNGTAHRFIEWLSDRPVDDFSITPPDVEQIFYRYYE